MKVARFQSHYSVKSQAYNLDTILREIARGETSVITADAVAVSAGGNTLKHATEHARRLLVAGNKQAYDGIKQALPACCFQGVSSKRTREIDTLSGLVVCEYDNVDDPVYWLSVVSQNPFVRAAFVSMGGHGLKVIGIALEKPTTENYHLAWFGYSLLFEEIGTADPTGARVGQMNAVAYADLFYENVDALPFDWSAVDVDDYTEAYPVLIRDVQRAAIASLPVEYRDAVRDLEWKPDGWGTTSLPCMFTEHEFDGWGARTNGMGVLRNADNDYTFHCLKCGASKRYEVPRAIKIEQVRAGILSPLSLRKPVPELPVDKERHKRALRAVEDNAAEIAKAFDLDARVVGLRAGTGEGKTEQAVSYAVGGGSVAITLNSTPLAEQVYSRFDAAETHAFLWRSRWFGYGGDTELSAGDRDFLYDSEKIICIKPEICDASRLRGIPAPRGVCPSCEKYDGCSYLSQFPIAARSQVFCVAQPELFINPTYAGFFSQVSDGVSDDRLYIIDEAKAVDLFLDCSLPVFVLEQWVRDWSNDLLGAFARGVLSDMLIEKLNPYAVVDRVSELSDDAIKQMSRQAARYVVQYTREDRGATDRVSGAVYASQSVKFAGGVMAYVAVNSDGYAALRDRELPVLPPQSVLESGTLEITPSQAFGLGIYEPVSENDFEVLPFVYENQNWTPFHQLKAFAEKV